jgi:hypothetical protein
MAPGKCESWIRMVVWIQLCVATKKTTGSRDTDRETKFDVSRPA